MKVTNNCNLACPYCYNREQKNRTFMSRKVLETTIAKVLNRFDHVRFIWHGGEPLLVGKNFFKVAKKYQLKYQSIGTNKTFKNSIQTNGTKLDKEWAKWFKLEDFSIGISIDGPEDITNQSRFTRNGASFDDICRGIGFIRNETGGVGVICVVHKLNAFRGAEVYDFFKKIHVDSVALLPNMNDPRLPDYHLDDQAFFAFHKDFFNSWIHDPDPIEEVIPFRQIINSLLGYQPNLCSYSAGCFRDFLAIEPDGSVYPCSALCSDKYLLGNISRDDIDKLYASSRIIKLRQDMAMSLKKLCGNCQYLAVCQGGCREAANIAYGSLEKKDPQCAGRQQLFEHVKTKLKEQLGNKLKAKVRYPTSNERKWDLVCH